MPSAKPVPTSIQVACLAACAPDSSDRGSARIRLPAAAWIAASVPYHSPVLVTIEDGSSPEPWRLLCISASLDPPGTPPTAPSPSPSPSPPHNASSNPQYQHQEPLAVVDPTIVSVPPGRHLSQLPALLAARPAATLLPCRGPIIAATEVVVELPPGLEHLASTLRFKLHQALVALGPPGRDGGCHVRLSDTVAVRVVSALPASVPARGTASVTAEPALFRIVPSTRILLAAPHCQSEQQQQQQQQQQEQQEQQQGKAQRSPCGRLHGGTRSAEEGRAEGQSARRPAAEDELGSTEAGAAGEGRSRGTKKATSKGSKSKGSVIGAEVEAERRKGGDVEGARCQGAVEGGGQADGLERQEGGDEEGQGKGGGKKTSSAKSKAGGEKKKKSTKGKGIAASASAFDALMGLDDDA